MGDSFQPSYNIYNFPRVFWGVFGSFINDCGSVWYLGFFYLRIWLIRIFWIQIFPTHVRGYRTLQRGGIHNLLGYFGSLVMGPSWIWIFMKMNIFIFEVLKSQDFLDPDFSDTRIWVQDPHKNEWNYGYPHFEGSLTHIYLSKIPPRNYGYPLFEGNNRPYITGTKYIIMTWLWLVIH